ncbi:MAG: hypothetical protein QOH81_2697 [Sphingomonadales bacterium]|jgi:CRP-like cAMP-binding protein|nr:hypothetical protein [Sphingomonadales bacterium]
MDRHLHPPLRMPGSEADWLGMAASGAGPKAGLPPRPLNEPRATRPPLEPADGGPPPTPQSADLRALFQRTETRRGRVDIFREGGVANRCCLILSGWACRYRVMADGERAILGFLLPGDLFGAVVDADRVMDHGVGTLCDVTLATIAAEEISRLVDTSPGIAAALRRHALADRTRMRDWLASVGRNNAWVRVAVLLRELWERGGNAGLIRDGFLPLPLTQSHLADALGLTAVHANRTIRALRQEGLIEWRERQLRVAERPALEPHRSAPRPPGGI